MIAFLYISIYFFLEAVREKYVIAMKSESSPNYRSNNRKEHFWSLVIAFVAAIPALFFIWLADQPFMLIPIFFSRRMFFDFALIKLRARNPRLYEGDGWFDEVGRKVFGTKGRLAEFYTQVGIVFGALVVQGFASSCFLELLLGNFYKLCN